MKTFFRPSSIAVIGASDRESSLGCQLIINLQNGYDGKIYPVNPNYAKVRGIPCFPSTEAIPASVDLAIIIVPAAAVPAALEDCGRRGIQRVIIESAGFAEVGEKGKKLQERCTAIARATGIRVWGPNCMGLVDVPRGYNFTIMYNKAYEDLFPGRVSLIVQSGLLAAGFLTDLMSERSIGVGKACSIGNKADVDECDLLEYLLEDEDTDAVAMYLESFLQGRRLLELARKSTKPIVVLKGGKSSRGAQAAMSHTSSLAGNARLQESLLEQAGVTIAHDFHEMMDLARTMAMIPDTPPHCRTAIVSFSGAACILCCDLLEKQELAVAEISDRTKKKLAEFFPEWLPGTNPVDLFPVIASQGPRVAYESSFMAMLKDPQVDVIFCHIFAGIFRDFEAFKLMKQAADRAGKGIVLWIIGIRDCVKQLEQDAELCHIPAFGELSRAVACIAAASRYQPRKEGADEIDTVKTRLSPPAVSELIEKGKEFSIWDEYDSKRLLNASGIPVVEERIVRTVKELTEAGRGIGYPAVLKGLIPGEVHKTESGLVRLGLSSSSALRSAYQDIKARMDGRGRLILQRQVAIDYELIAGFLNDGEFGPCIMFGLGGVFSELQRDVVFSLAPTNHQEAKKMLQRIKGKRLFYGFRGMKPLDEELMADILVRLGDLGGSCPEIAQIDVNPLIVSQGRPLAVDATVILKR